MHLTKEEERALDGEFGFAIETAMYVLVKIGEMYSADRMIEISNVHIDASTYAGIHEAGLQFCKKLVDEKARFRVPATLCISAIDFSLWKELRIPKNFVIKQLELAKAYLKMGATGTWTCAPYQYGSGIRFGQNIAWAESNAIAFANSVVGARTNRYADLVDICAALVGKVPRFGLYLNKNRFGQILIKTDELEARTLTYADCSVLGYYLGAIVGHKVPVIDTLSHKTSVDQLKGLSAAAASSGSVALFHVVGLTPEAKTVRDAFGVNVVEDKICVGIKELKRVAGQLSTMQEGEPELIVLGCPHHSVEQIGEVQNLLNGRKVRNDVQLWLFTSRVAKMLAKEKKYVEVIENAGGRVLSDTCPLHLPLKRWHFQIMATDSAKIAHYAPSITGLDVVFADTKECLEYATGKKNLVESWHCRNSC